MKQPKIVFIDHTAVMGGAELCLLDLANAYTPNCKVILFEDGLLRQTLEKAGINVCIAPVSKNLLALRTSGGLNSLSVIPELLKIAGFIAKEAQGYDLILANSQKAFITSALAAMRNSPPIFWYLHDILTAQHFSQVNRLAAVFLANKFATKTIVNSQATGQAFMAAGGRKELLEVVYNGFEAQKFDTVSTTESQVIRDRLNIDNAPLVGLFSRLSYWKGQHIILEAVKELSQVHLMLVGEALFGEQEYVARLKKLANQPELRRRVHWLGFRDDIPALMKACDLVVHTSTEPEPFGRVIIEGQLAQKPVIASAGGGALELIDDGVTGCLFPPEDATALRQQIKKLLENPTLADRIAQRGYHNAKTNFSLANTLDSFAKAIATVDLSG